MKLKIEKHIGDFFPKPEEEILLIWAEEQGPVLDLQK